MCTYYFLLTGKLPFEAASVPALGYLHAHQPFPDPRQFVPDLPARLCRILERGAQKNPDQRYQSANQLVSELDAFLSNAPLCPIPISPPIPKIVAFPDIAKSRARLKRRSPANRVAAGGIAAAVVLLGIVIYIKTKDGTVTIKTDDPNVQIHVESSDASPPSVQPRLNAPADGTKPAPDATISIKSLVPDDTLIDATKNKLREDYKNLVAGEEPRNKSEWAKLLIKRSAEISNTTTRFAVLDLAAELGMDAGDFLTFLEACNQIGKFFDIDVLAKKIRMLKTAAQREHTADGLDLFLEALLLTGFEAWADDRHKEASVLSTIATGMAKKSAASHWLYQAEFFEEEVRKAAPIYERIKPLLETLKAQPADPRANLEVGKFLCFVKNEWDSGLPKLAIGSDRSLKGIAAMELRNSTEWVEQISLGNAWWEQSSRLSKEEALDCKVRTKYWYTKALADPAMNKPELADQLLVKINSFPSRRVSLRIEVFHSDFDDLQISNDGLKLVLCWFGRPSYRINHLRWSPQAVGETIKNSGPTRLFPNAIDFSTVQMRTLPQVGVARPDGTEHSANSLFSCPTNLKAPATTISLLRFTNRTESLDGSIEASLLGMRRCTPGTPRLGTQLTTLERNKDGASFSRAPFLTASDYHICSFVSATAVTASRRLRSPVNTSLWWPRPIGNCPPGNTGRMPWPMMECAFLLIRTR